MSVSNLVVSQDYVCNGVTTSFAIPFDYLKMEQIVVELINITTGVVTPWTMGSQYDLNPPYDPLYPNIYTQVVAVSAPASGNRLRIRRETALVQDSDYINSGQLLLDELERSFDKLTFMEQELNRKLTAVPQLADIDTGMLTVKLNMAGANKILAVKSDGTGLYWADLSEVASGGGGGVPPGGVAGDFIEKLSSTDGDADWKSGSYDGISALTGAQFTSTGLKDTLDKIIRITYTPPTISLAASGNGTIREKGDPVTSTTLTATTVKKSNPIGEVRFYRNPSTLLQTDTSGGGIPNGGVNTHNYATSFSDNVTFRAEVDDTLVGGNGPTTVSATASFTFVYPYYTGAGAVGLSAAAVAGLTKLLIVSTATVTRTFTATSGQVFYFAYPASYGALTSILDVNNFETLPDWTLTTTNITGLDGNAVSYRIYAFNNPVVAGSYQYTFKR